MTNIKLFSQIISKLDRFSFTKLVCVHQTDKHQKRLHKLDASGGDAFLSVCQKSVGT